MGNQSFPAEILSQVAEGLHAMVQNYWSDWQLACEKKYLPVMAGIDLPVLGKIWACSDFAAQVCIRHPDILLTILKEGVESDRHLSDYQKIVAATLDQGEHNDVLVMHRLRCLRQREMLRICWRDLSHCTEAAQILYELSDLAEAFVVQTLFYIETQSAKIFGQPVDTQGLEQSMLVLAMGKMGGRELNFSSDIDLIFAYAEEGETVGPRRISHHEYFLWVAKKLIRYLGEISVDGFVYRVDTRLRPNGASGALVTSFAAMENYYQLQGRNWERYAMVKARIISGCDEHRESLQTLLTPFIYRRYLDYSAFEAIREMKAMIGAQVKRKGMKSDIKLGQGGIREIEFIGQTFQLLRGGREAELRVRSIVAVLHLLSSKNYLTEIESNQLIAAYWFLRRLENRLQMQFDKQTHNLPDDDVARLRLCLSIDVANWETLLQQLAVEQKRVSKLFSRLIVAEKIGTDEQGDKATQVAVTAEALALFWQDTDNTDLLADWLLQLGFQSAEPIIKQLLLFHNDTSIKRLGTESRRRLLPLLSTLLAAAAAYSHAEQLVSRVLNILQSIAGRAVYLSMLNEYPALGDLLLRLCDAGDWFAQNIADYPLLLDSLLNTEDLFSLQQDETQLQYQLKQIGFEHKEDLLGEQMDRLRQFKRQRVFNIAMLDVFYELPVEAVADQLTATADALLKQSLQLAWQEMLVRYGEPQCVLDNGEYYKPVLSIIAYGKLGGHELGYDSDLDIIFLHDSRGDRQQTLGLKCIDNQQFFVRVAQRVIHILSTRTYAGVLYETDTRLRPDGQAGLMVSSLQAFATYQQEKAWTWEHQALIRARFVSGSSHVESEFDRIRCRLLRQRRNAVDLLRDVVAMREKMRVHLAAKTAKFAVTFDVKQDAGGLIDIEFMTQAGVLLQASAQAECVQPTATLALIKALVKMHWFVAEEAEQLAAAYRYFRKLKNWQSLKCELDDSAVQAHRKNVINIWQRLMPGKES